MSFALCKKGLQVLATISAPAYEVKLMVKDFFLNVFRNWAGTMYDWNCSYTHFYNREVWRKEELHYPVLGDALTQWKKIKGVANYRFSFFQCKFKWDESETEVKAVMFYAV